MSRRQTPAERIAPDGFIDEMAAEVDRPVDTLEDALEVAEELPTSSDPDSFERCRYCLATRLRRKIFAQEMSSRNPEPIKCTNCLEHFREPVLPIAEFDAADPICPNCENRRLVEADGLENTFECLDCGDTFDKALDEQRPRLMRERIETATERNHLSTEAPPMTRYAAMVAYCRVTEAASRGNQLAAALNAEAETNHTETMNGTDAFEWIETDDLTHPVVRHRRTIRGLTHDERVELAIRLYRPWEDDGPSYRDLETLFSYSRTWIGDRIREWKDDGDHHDLVAPPWPTVDKPTAATAQTREAAE